MKENARERLVSFLDRKVFDPILKRKGRGFDERQKRTLEQVQKKTDREKERFHNYRTAERVRRAYLNDLSSEPAQRVNAKLEQLGLPKLPDVHDDFLSLCDRLGVEEGETGKEAKRRTSSRKPSSRGSTKRASSRSGTARRGGGERRSASSKSASSGRARSARA